MDGSKAEHRIFLSFTWSDAKFAERIRVLLQKLNVQVLIPDDTTPAGPLVIDAFREMMSQATITMVLIGSVTRKSQWVDSEIELTTKANKSGPGAGLIGVVLPTHDDFRKPYYEPELVPLRLHDRIQAEYAILRKWSDEPTEIDRWLLEADRRRRQYDPTCSLRGLLELRRFQWSPDVDKRPEVAPPNIIGRYD